MVDEAGDSEFQYFEEPNPGVLRVLPSGKRVLDVGCGFGALGDALKEKGNYVVGTDISAYAVERARGRYDETYVCDLQSPAPYPFEGGEPFDVVIFGDVLEHLYDPAGILRRFRPYVKDDGKVIVSLPNIAAWPIRLGLLFGQFNYRDTGTLDKTHIRFFTRKTSRQLVEDNGYRVESFSITPNFARALLQPVRMFFLSKDDVPQNPRAIIDSAAYRFYIEYIFPLETLVARLRSPLFAFQFIYVASPDPSFSGTD